MSIEIKQMVVKTQVVHSAGPENRSMPEEAKQAAEQELGRLLDECRRLLAELRREKRER